MSFLQCSLYDLHLLQKEIVKVTKENMSRFRRQYWGRECFCKYDIKDGNNEKDKFNYKSLITSVL